MIDPGRVVDPALPSIPAANGVAAPPNRDTTGVAG